MIRRAPILAALLLANAAFSALGPRYGGGLTIGVSELPLAGSEASPGSTARALWSLTEESLVRMNQDGPAPSLATWASAASGKEWMLTLPEQAVFHDGQPLTAREAADSLRRFLSQPSSAADAFAASLEGGSAFRAGTTNDLPGLATPDERRLRLRFGEARAAALAPLASPAAAIRGRNGSGAGPFVPLLRTPGRSLSLRAFAAHVRGRPFLDRVEVVALGSQEAVQLAYRGGRVELALGEPGEGARAGLLLLVLDKSRTPFDDLLARAAVDAALDRRALARFLAPSNAPVLELEAPGAAQVPAPQARLSGAVMLAVDSELPPLASQRVVAHLSALGLRVSVDARPAGRARAETARARLLLFVPEVSEEALTLLELSSLAAAGPEVRQAVENAEREASVEPRRLLLERARALLDAEKTCLVLARVPLSWAVRPGVHGTRLDAAGRLVLEDAWLEP